MVLMPSRVKTIAVVVVFLVTLLCWYGVANSATQTTSDKIESAKTPPADEVGRQIKELQIQVADLQKRMNEVRKPRIIAAGTATLNLGGKQDNTSFVRVKLSDEITTKLGDEYIVLVTNRLPTPGYYYSAYWKPAKDGFDLMLINPEVGPGNSHIFTTKIKDFLIDWIVVKK